MSRLTSIFAARAAFILLGIGMAPVANAALMASNATLADGSPGFNLVEKDPGPTQSPVDFLVGFNAVQVSPGPINLPTLDLGDASSPLLNNPATGTSFSIFWGMANPGPSQLPAVQFTLPTDPAGGLHPPNPNLDGSYGYDFSATDGTNMFDIFFTITGSTAMDTASWGMVNPGPSQLPAVQFNFDFLAPADPTLSFLVYENGQQLSFSPIAAVPEPATYTMLLAGLGLIGFMARRKQIFTA